MTAEGTVTEYNEILVSVRNDLFKTLVRRAGTGPPLLYLHGAGGFSAWTPFFARLSEQFTLYIPDHPGWGQSEGLAYIDDVIDLAIYYFDLLDALELHEVYLIGHSIGGMFAAEMAALCSHRFPKLVLVAPAGLWLDAAPMPDIFTLSPEEMAPIMWHDPQCEAAIRQRTPPAGEQLRNEFLLERAKAQAAAAKFLWPLPDKGLKKRIHRVQTPTLIVWGESDRLVPAATAPVFRELIKGSRLELIPACGHLPMLERPDVFSRVVLQFLQEESG